MVDYDGLLEKAQLHRSKKKVDVHCCAISYPSIDRSVIWRGTFFFLRPLWHVFSWIQARSTSSPGLGLQSLVRLCDIPRYKTGSIRAFGDAILIASRDDIELKLILQRYRGRQTVQGPSRYLIVIMVPGGAVPRQDINDVSALVDRGTVVNRQDANHHHDLLLALSIKVGLVMPISQAR